MSTAFEKLRSSTFSWISPSAVAPRVSIWTMPTFAQNVKITPLGSHAGELCDRDRATIFEDPTGVRILYDADVRFLEQVSE